MAEHFGVKRQLDMNPRDDKQRGSDVQQTSPDYTGKPNPAGTLSSAPYGSQSGFNSSAANRAGGESGTQHDRISRRAYELWEQRGRQNGHELEDWLRAEREVKRA